MHCYVRAPETGAPSIARWPSVSARRCWPGGNVRVGLEDNLFLEKGVLATNAQLVKRAVRVIEGMGAPQDVREKLGLIKRDPR